MSWHVDSPLLGSSFSLIAWFFFSYYTLHCMRFSGNKAHFLPVQHSNQSQLSNVFYLTSSWSQAWQQSSVNKHPSHWQKKHNCPLHLEFLHDCIFMVMRIRFIFWFFQTRETNNSQKPMCSFIKGYKNKVLLKNIYMPCPRFYSPMPFLLYRQISCLRISPLSLIKAFIEKRTKYMNSVSVFFLQFSSTKYFK